MLLPLYDLTLRGYELLIRLAGPFNPKAARWTHGRRDWLPRLRAAVAAWSGSPVLWMHCASLGEFEQGRPVLEALRMRHGTGLKLLVTFFSPSGYDIRHNWPGADYVTYLPPDSALNARLFLEAAQPTAAIFVKYEFWYHYLYGLRQRGVPTFLIAATLRPTQAFFKPWGGLFRELLRGFTHIYAQNDATTALLHGVGMTDRVTVAGDPRYDRVLATANANRRLPLLDTWVRDSAPVLVVGSAWAEDLRALAPTLQRHIEHIRVIVAPHEVDESHVHEAEQLLTQATGALVLRYSRIAHPESPTAVEEAVALDLLRASRIVLIDSIGLLSTVYGYAAVAYVGGAFGRGLHNILEAAVFGAPVLFGPRIGRFPEAGELMAAGGGRSVASAAELDTAFTHWLEDQAARAQAGAAAAAFVRTRAGATTVIMAGLAPWLPSVRP